MSSGDSHGRITSGIEKNTGPRQTLRFIENHLAAWRDDPERVEVEPERELNSQLCKFLNARARQTDFSMVQFHHEQPQGTRHAIDLSASLSEGGVIEGRQFTKYDPDFGHRMQEIAHSRVGSAKGIRQWGTRGETGRRHSTIQVGVARTEAYDRGDDRLRPEGNVQPLVHRGQSLDWRTGLVLGPALVGRRPTEFARSRSQFASDAMRVGTCPRKRRFFGNSDNSFMDSNVQNDP